MMMMMIMRGEEEEAVAAVCLVALICIRRSRTVVGRYKHPIDGGFYCT
jgi:hypothetical protein